jgi:hypothetical protein
VQEISFFWVYTEGILITEIKRSRPEAEPEKLMVGGLRICAHGAKLTELTWFDKLT